MAETNLPEEKSSARKSHLSSLLTYLVAATPIAALFGPYYLAGAALIAGVVPLTMWLLNRKKRYVAEQAAEATFFQVGLAAALAAVPWSFPESKPLRFLGFASIGLFHFASLIYATIQTSYGKDFSHLFSPMRLFFKDKSKQELEDKILSGEIDKATAQMSLEVVKSSTLKTKEIDALVQKIRDPEMKKLGQSIVASLQKVLQNFIDDPRDIMPARHFMSYTLDTLVRIIKKYNDLYSEREKNPSLQETLNKVEPVLKSIYEAIEANYQKMLENDLLELDADLDVMEKTIQMGGL
ncbi:MAG: 5-bromo-4-chloroindolyl phosphate hydrolysis family protein [Leptospiraceae bacterium]|nr:5-bromo-4-chloroindolyl phosphate hydrolysis family protein [Leptospiraceae bacterium]